MSSIIASVRLGLALSAPILLSACALGQVGAVIHPTVSGSLTIHAADGTQSQWTPDRCLSGDLGYFLGFDFAASADQNQLRAMRQPTGEVLLRWTTPAGSATFRSGDCTRLDLAIQPTGWRVNEVREFAGYIDMHCAAADGTRLEGRISVDHCH